VIKKLIVLSCLLAALSVFFPSYGEDGNVGPSSGVEYLKISHPTPAGPVEVHALRVDLSHPGTRIRPALARGRIGSVERTSLISTRHLASGAINASFFDNDGIPLGMVMIDGRLLAEPILKRTVMGITGDSRILWDNPSFKAKIVLADSYEIFLDGLNRRRRSRRENIIYTKEFGGTTPVDPSVKEITVADGSVASVRSGGGSDILQTDGGYVISIRDDGSIIDRVKPGDRATLHLNLKEGWEGIVHAVGGGPRLVRSGQIEANYQSEGFQESVSQSIAPRSAMGVTSDGFMLLVVVDGRRINSPGISLAGLAELMLKLGAVDAMNLDGGGSSTLVYKGQVMNHPSDGFERPVSVAIVVID